MKKILPFVLALMLVTLVFVTPAYARGSMPVGTCPTGFTLMEYMDGNHQDMPMHIGLATDLNGNGYICMKVVTPNLHVHMDDVLPLP